MFEKLLSLRFCSPLRGTYTLSPVASRGSGDAGISAAAGIGDAAGAHSTLIG